MPGTSAPLLDVEGLTIEFATDRGRVTVVEDATFSINSGEIVGLVGESGSGKSVSCLAMLGLLDGRSGRVSGGSVRLRGYDLVGLSRRELENIRGSDISMVFQEPMTSLNPAFTVGEQIAEVVRRHRQSSRREAWQRAVQVLDDVGIPNPAARARSYPHQFSGGMRQRVVIAMALACDPSVLLADEPTTALDVTIQAQVIDLIRDAVRERGMGVLFVTHDLGVVAEVADRVVVMYAGEIVESGTVFDIFDRPAHPYTRALLDARPHRGVGTRGELATIPGEVPPPGSHFQGCRFAARCPMVSPSCEMGRIELRSIDVDRKSRCVLSEERDGD